MCVTFYTHSFSQLVDLMQAVLYSPRPSSLCAIIELYILTFYYYQPVLILHNLLDPYVKQIIYTNKELYKSFKTIVYS